LMAQYDVFRNPDSRTRRAIPFLLDVQSDLLEPLATRVVVPLVRKSEMPRPARRLNPVFKIEDVEVVMSTPELAGVLREALGNKVGSLSEKRDEIISALDLLFTGI
jgi:toxin CcdB